MFNICRHIYTKVDDKGYQYCIKCMKAKLVGLPKCIHKWKTIDTLERENILTRNTVGFIYIQRCTECGEVNKVNAP